MPAHTTPSLLPAADAPGVPTPTSFLWGAATSAHQTEGNNVGSDLWALEVRSDSPLSEPSGDACDSYHRWPEDLDIVRDLGLNAYRFGIEWSRIEPAPGRISQAALGHYRRIIDGCLERGITPVVTLHHFTSPAWFRTSGGWTAPGGVETFARYVRAVRPILDGVTWACTINEPNMLAMVAARVGGTDPDLVAGALPPPDQPFAEALIRAHHAARDELAEVGGLRSGWTVANQTFQPLPGAEEAAREWAWSREDQFLEAARHDDFIGVQAYTRVVIGPDGPVPPDPAARRTQTGWEFYPEALEAAVRHTAARIPTPILVTENGIATDNDDERREYLHHALTGLGRALADGVDVRGYLHWSLLDNYEWGSWHATFGLTAVDRRTFQRVVKPSARWYGRLAQTCRLPGA
ncbi:family 1 glycosylhydrolase [Micromonospora sp. NPDC047812]|uniref:glycoside hydrolase family 1 protein n=1 Tax=Micromonospora sp. NPDC047812 TaxID=3155742 RepID=UPI0034520C5B